jgi:hypothetical protein
MLPAALDLTIVGEAIALSEPLRLPHFQKTALAKPLNMARRDSTRVIKDIIATARTGCHVGPLVSIIMLLLRPICPRDADS